MTNTEITKSIQKVSLVILTGILGIVVFLNTALVQQTASLGYEEVELEMVLNGINLFTFILLILSILFFISIMPFEEVEVALKKLKNKDVSNLSFSKIFNLRLILFVIGVIIFSLVFIVFMVLFAFTFF
jgi:ABC-type Na+ efflux pump permease subunit